MDRHDDIAELFHENSKLAPYQTGLDLTELPEPLSSRVVLQRVRLPRVRPTTRYALEEAIEARYTHRTFNPHVALPLETLARVLAFSCGFTTPFWCDGLPHLRFRRAAPSAGATYPIEVFPIALRVEGLTPGAYHYATRDHSLELLRVGDFGASFVRWVLHQPYVGDASVLFVMAGFAERIKPRYGERGYRYMLFEAGHIAHNMNLLAAAYGLGALCDGGFVDTAISRLLGLDEVTEIPLYIVAMGVRS